MLLLNAPADDLEDTFRHSIFLWIDVEAPDQKPSFVLVYDAVLADFGPAVITTFLKRFAAPCQPLYGYAFKRPFRLGPEFYVFGTLQGITSLSDDPDIARAAEEVTLWKNHYVMPDGTYTLGDLRDVYPYNWLCATHLARKITVAGHTQTLKAFIKASPDHGSLLSAGADRWIWHLDEAQRLKVRNLLKPTGPLLCVL
ncbi:MAG: hypothetical protein ACPG7U_02085 [Holosporaceae bacterium]